MGRIIAPVDNMGCEAAGVEEGDVNPISERVSQLFRL